jgi:hypothetical protein
LGLRPRVGARVGARAPAPLRVQARTHARTHARTLVPRSGAAWTGGSDGWLQTRAPIQPHCSHGGGQRPPKRGGQRPPKQRRRRAANSARGGPKALQPHTLALQRRIGGGHLLGDDDGSEPHQPRASPSRRPSPQPLGGRRGSGRRGRRRRGRRRRRRGLVASSASCCAHLGHVGATGPHKGCRGESPSPLPVTIGPSHSYGRTRLTAAMGVREEEENVRFGRGTGRRRALRR